MSVTRPTIHYQNDSQKRENGALLSWMTSKYVESKLNWFAWLMHIVSISIKIENMHNVIKFSLDISRAIFRLVWFRGEFGTCENGENQPLNFAMLFMSTIFMLFVHLCAAKKVAIWWKILWMGVAKSVTTNQNKEDCFVPVLHNTILSITCTKNG